MVGVRLLSAVGADCVREPPVSHGGFGKNFLFCVACLVTLFALGNLDSSPSPSYLSVACGVQRIVFFGTACATWIDSGYMFFEGFGRISAFFYVAVNSNPEVFGLHSF